MEKERVFNILVVDDERELRESLKHILTAMRHRVFEADCGETALRMIRESGTDTPGSIHMVFLDVHMPQLSGLDVLREIRSFDPAITVLILTAHGNIRDAVDAIQMGAYNYLEKPIHDADIAELVGKASRARDLVRKIGFSSPKLVLDGADRFDRLSQKNGFVGNSSKMRSVFQLIQRLGQVNTSVLIRGDSGTGKELVARAIHFNSTRKDFSFVAVNCGAIQENLVESEFFGHEKGAFTGADQRHIGRFQYAEGGTLFLDEIGDISPSMQVKLLRVLQEKKFTPVGSNREIRCDVRIIAATNRNLEEMIEKNVFRQDLFYRLNVMPIQLPSLKERLEDIPALVEHFIEKFNLQYPKNGALETRSIRKIERNALEALMSHTWPGNIRELENIIERAFVLENSESITLQSLPEEIQWKAGGGGITKTDSGLPDATGKAPIDFHFQKERFEREFILTALRRFGGRINQTVAQAGIPKNTLLRKMRKYGISPAEFGATAADETEG